MAMEFRHWLQKNMDDAGLGQQDLADAIGENQPTIQRILSGETKNPRLKIVTKLQKFFGSNSPADSEATYPRVVGTARMGDKGYYLDLEGGNGHIEFEAAPGSIAIHVRGDSMYPAIRDGWYVIIEPSGKPTAGEYVLLGFNDGRKMVKELLMEKFDCYVVESVNGGERITIMKEELANMRAISAVVPPSKHKQ